MSINRVKITLELTKNYAKLNQAKTEDCKDSLETETSTKFSWVKPRLDKLNQEINRG